MDWAKHFAEVSKRGSTFGAEKRNLSPTGKTFIQKEEGLSLTAYPDAAGYSIGYGHFGAKKGDVISRAEADRLFDQDIQSRVDSVNAYAPNTTQAQFDALVSLAYNIGLYNFQTSTLLRKHIAGDYAGAAEEFLKWKKSEGKDNPVLLARRTRERAMYLGGSAASTSGPVSTGGSTVLSAIFGLLFSAGLIYYTKTKTRLLG